VTSKSQFLALTALLLAVGCSGSGSEGPDAGPHSVDGGADTAIAPDISEDGSLPDLGPEPDVADLVDLGPEDTSPEIAVGPPFPGGLATDLEAILDDHFPTMLAPGVILTAALPGFESLDLALGKTQDEPLALTEVGDRFRVGSVTKTFVAAATLQLVEEGVIGLDDPIEIWVPGYALGSGVTIRRLMNHTSGIPNFTDDPSFLAKALEHGEPEDVIAFALEMEFLFAPGDGYSYSNTGYYFLGLMLEAATGLPVAQVLRDRLLGPYGLDDTFLEGAEPIEGAYVEGYIAGAEAPFTDMSWAWTAGAMVSTGADLCAWFEALYRGDVVSPAHRDLMTTRTSLWGGGAIVDYGLGTQIMSQGGTDVFGHTGSTVGSNCAVFIEPGSGACLALLTNDFFGVPSEANAALWQRLIAHLDGTPQ
jgi:D-alanyl-D-alanine carboxypeptidase